VLYTAPIWLSWAGLSLSLSSPKLGKAFPFSPRNPNIVLGGIDKEFKELGKRRYLLNIFHIPLR
jgi:hypothetical protein